MKIIKGFCRGSRPLGEGSLKWQSALPHTLCAMRHAPCSHPLAAGGKNKKKIIGLLVIFIIFTAFAGVNLAQKDTTAGKKRSKASQKKLNEILKNWTEADKKKDAVNILKYASQALKIFQSENNPEMEAETLANISRAHQKLKNYKKALEYGKKALTLAKKTNYQFVIAASLDILGGTYFELSDYDRALENYLESLKIKEKMGDPRFIAASSGNIGNIYASLGQYDKSLEFQDKALKIANDTGNQWGIVTSLLSMGNVYNSQQNYDEAMECYKKGLEIAKKINAKVLINECYKGVSAVHEAKRDYQQSLEYYKLFHQADKSLVDEKSRKQLDQLQVQYETEKKEQEIVVLKKNNEIQQLRLSRERITRNAFIIGFILVLIILALLFKKYLYLFTFWKKQEYIGQFRLMEKIAVGGMGTIYKAHRIVNKSEIAAIKILREELFSDATTKKRFQREAAIIDRLTHPNIINIFERGESKQKIFIAMEFLEGKTLERKIDEEGGLTLHECLHIMMQISEVFVFIHSKNIIHRDLKPANIMLIKKNGDPNFVKLLDFGLAKMEVHTRLTQSGNFVGTIEYIPPEQLISADTSPANDIFSMGVTFYKMLCGRLPFPGETVIDIMRQIIGKNPPPVSEYRSDIPGELNHLVMQMIQKKPSQRPSAGLIRNQLQHVSVSSMLSPLS
ncbi:MAG: protein kinase [Candidatus Aminicenantes bacterium]|nr:MAG: protein kinase [Candidatus Aminicenantes bacterium]